MKTTSKYLTSNLFLFFFVKLYESTVICLLHFLENKSLDPVDKQDLKPSVINNSKFKI